MLLKPVSLAASVRERTEGRRDEVESVMSPPRKERKQMRRMTSVTATAPVRLPTAWRFEWMPKEIVQMVRVERRAQIRKR
jgi:hypothetical protein